MIPRSEIAKAMATGKTEALHPEYGLKEKVRYIGLAKKFIAGTVVLGDKDEVAVGAEVTLSGNGKEQTRQDQWLWRL